MKKIEDIRTYIWVEFAVWFLILCLCITGLRLYRYKEEKKLPSYQIFLPDVDGLIEGSPVKYMGVQVGYIDKIKIVTNSVYIKFVIQDRELNLPKGAVATVEFSGMGGSKSLEIYPPNKQSLATGKLIFVQDPKRLHDSLGMLGDMYDKIGSITGRISFFTRATGLDQASGKPAELLNLKGIDTNVITVEKWIDLSLNKRNKKNERKHDEQGQGKN